MSKFSKSIKSVIFASLLIPIISFSSCNKDDNSSEEEVCYTCTRSAKADGSGDSQYFCDSKTDAENTKVHYESLGYTCVKN